MARTGPVTNVAAMTTTTPTTIRSLSRRPS